MLTEFLVYERVVEVNPGEVIVFTSQLIMIPTNTLQRPILFHNSLPFLIKMHPE